MRAGRGPLQHSTCNTGRRFGRHRWIALGGGRSPKTLEGSLAFFVASLLCTCVGTLAFHRLGWCGVGVGGNLAGLALTALVASVIEALCPSDWDNIIVFLASAPVAALTLQ
jgi:dolichol kinase